MGHWRYRPRCRAAFTLLEMVVVLMIVATVAILVMPTLSDDGRLRLMAAAAVVTSDIELAQVMTIAHPEDAVVVRFDPAGGRYWLAYADDPLTPIDRADTGDPYVVELGRGRAAGAGGVTYTTQDIADDTLAFDAHGGVRDITASPSVTLALDGAWIRVQVAPTTGSVTETDGP